MVKTTYNKSTDEFEMDLLAEVPHICSLCDKTIEKSFYKINENEYNCPECYKLFCEMNPAKNIQRDELHNYW